MVTPDHASHTALPTDRPQNSRPRLQLVHRGIWLPRRERCNGAIGRTVL